MRVCINCGKEESLKRFSGTRKRCKDCRNRSNKVRNANIKDVVFAVYGGYKCKCCGESVKDFLVIDHIYGGGKAHIKQVNYNLYEWLAKNFYPEGFQVLCMNCNFGRAKNNGICPHKLLESSTTISKESTSQVNNGDGSAKLQEWVTPYWMMI